MADKDDAAVTEAPEAAPQVDLDAATTATKSAEKPAPGPAPAPRAASRAKVAAAKPAGAKPSAGRASAASKVSTTKAGSAAKPAAAKPDAAKATSSNKADTAHAGSGATAASAEAKEKALHDHRLEALAERLRKLNERIIDAGREAGEATLHSYERALKTIANGLENGPGSSEIDWLAQVATAQARFIRDLTDTWTKAARDRFK